LKTISATLFMLVVLTTTAVAGDPKANSANHYLAACRELASQQSPSQSFAQGECIGVIAALSYVAKDLPSRYSGLHQPGHKRPVGSSGG